MSNTTVESVARNAAVCMMVIISLPLPRAHPYKRKSNAKGFRYFE
jgi:hypothetical protein